MKLNHAPALSNSPSLPWEALGTESAPSGLNQLTDQLESLLRTSVAPSYAGDSHSALQNQCHKVLQPLEAALNAAGYGPQGHGAVEQSLLAHCLKHPQKGQPEHVFFAKDQGGLAVVHADGTLSDLRIDSLHPRNSNVGQDISLAAPTCTLPGRWVYDEVKAAGDATVLPTWQEPMRVDCQGLDASSQRNPLESPVQVFAVTEPGGAKATSSLTETPLQNEKPADTAHPLAEVNVGLVAAQQPVPAVALDTEEAQSFPVRDDSQAVSARQEIEPDPQALAPAQALSLHPHNALDALEELARKKYAQAMQLANEDIAKDAAPSSADAIESLLEQSFLINQLVQQERKEPFSAQPKVVESPVGSIAAAALESLASQKYEEAIALANANTVANPGDAQRVTSLLEQSYLLELAAGKSPNAIAAASNDKFADTAHPPAEANATLAVPQQPIVTAELDAADVQSFPVRDDAQAISTRQEISSESNPLAPQQELVRPTLDALAALDVQARQMYDQAMQLAAQTADNPPTDVAETIVSLLEQSFLISNVVQQERQTPYSVQPSATSDNVSLTATTSLQSLAKQKYEEAMALASADTGESPRNAESVASLMEQSYLLGMAAGQTSDSVELGALKTVVDVNRSERVQTDAINQIQTTKSKTQVVAAPHAQSHQFDSGNASRISESSADQAAQIKKRKSNNAEQAILNALPGEKSVTPKADELHAFCTEPYPVVMLRGREFTVSFNPLTLGKHGTNVVRGSEDMGDLFKGVGHISFGTGGSLAGTYVGLTCGYGSSKPTGAIRNVFSFGYKPDENDAEKVQGVNLSKNLTGNKKYASLLDNIGTTLDVVVTSSVKGDGASVTLMLGVEKKLPGTSFLGKYPYDNGMIHDLLSGTKLFSTIYGNNILSPATIGWLASQDKELEMRTKLVDTSLHALSTALDVSDLIPAKKAGNMALEGAMQLAMPKIAKLAKNIKFSSFNATASYLPNGIRPPNAHVITNP